MKLEQEFEVAAPLEQVWRALIDVERVAPNLPGAAVTGRNEDGSYNGTFAVKIGPTSASYEGKLEMVEVDDEAHTATMRADGTDKRGQGGAKATITSNVTEGDGGATRVSVVTDYRITGRLARFGRGGMIEDISEKLLKKFAASLQASLAAEGGAATGPAADAAAPPAEAPPVAPAPPPDPEPFDAGSVLADVAMERVRASPVPLILTVVALVILVKRVRRRRGAGRVGSGG